MGRLYSLAAEVRKPDSSVTVFFRGHFPHLSEIQAEFWDQVAALPTIRAHLAASTDVVQRCGEGLVRYWMGPCACCTRADEDQIA